MGMCMPHAWTWTMTLPSASLVAETLAFCGLHRQLMGKYRGCRLFGSAGTAFGEGACRHHPKHVQNPGSSGDWVAESCGNRCGVPRLAGTLTMTTTTDGGTQMPHQRTWTMNHSGTSAEERHRTLPWLIGPPASMQAWCLLPSSVGRHHPEEGACRHGRGKCKTHSCQCALVDGCYDHLRPCKQNRGS